MTKKKNRKRMWSLFMAATLVLTMAQTNGSIVRAAQEETTTVSADAAATDPAAQTPDAKIQETETETEEESQVTETEDQAAETESPDADTETQTTETEPQTTETETQTAGPETQATETETQATEAETPETEIQPQDTEAGNEAETEDDSSLILTDTVEESAANGLDLAAGQGQEVATVQIGNNTESYDNLQTAWAAAKAGSKTGSAATVTLKQNVSLGSNYLTVQSGENIILDAAGCTLSVDGTRDKGVIYVTGGTFTLSGGTLSAPKYYGLYVDGADSRVVIQGGTVSGYSQGIRAENRATVEVSGGLVTATSPGISYAITAFGISAGGNSSVIVRGGTISSTEIGIAMTGATASISGGTISGSRGGVLQINGGSQATVSGSAVIKTEAQNSYAVYVNNGSATISGGTLSSSIDATLRADNSNSSITVNGGTINNTTQGVYATGGSTITLNGGTITSSHTGVRAYSGTVYIHHGVSITGNVYGVMADQAGKIEMDGGSVTAYGSGQPCMYLNGGTAVISGGTITNKSGGYGVTVQSSGNATISGGTIYGTDTGLQIYSAKATVTAGTITGNNYAVYVQNAADTTEISGGTFTGNTCGLSVYNGTVKLSGGTFTGSTWSIRDQSTGKTVKGLLKTGYAYYIGETPTDGELISAETVLSSQYLNKSNGHGTVTVGAVPEPTVEPADTKITYGDSFSLSVSTDALGSGSISYQWYRDGAVLEGENQQSLTVSRLDAGSYTYSCQVTCGVYQMQSKTATVEVTPRELTITGIEAETKNYDGTTKAEVTKVTFDNLASGESLEPGVDYTVSCSFDSPDAGNRSVTASVTLQNGNYTLLNSSYTTPDKIGTIYPASLADAEIQVELPEGGFIYDGMEKTPSVIVKIGNETLVSSDYSVAFENNVDAGTAVVKVTAAPNTNYIGEGSTTFTIDKAEQKTPELSAAQETISGKADGTVSGLTTAMEYRAEGETAYTPVTDPEMTLAAGIWYFRYVGDENHNASADMQVTIAKGRMLKVRFVADGKEYAVKEVQWDETLTDIPEVPSREGYTQTAPYWDTTDFTHIREDMTVTAVYTADIPGTPGETETQKPTEAETNADTKETGNKANTKTPSTGDNTNLWLWMALLMISGGSIAEIWKYRTKKKRA